MFLSRNCQVCWPWFPAGPLFLLPPTAGLQPLLAWCLWSDLRGSWRGLCVAAKVPSEPLSRLCTGTWSQPLCDQDCLLPGLHSLHLENCSTDRLMEKHTRPTESSCESCVEWRVGPISHSASGSVLDQTLPDSQTLRLDETVDSMGDDDPFTAKLSFEVRLPL